MPLWQVPSKANLQIMNQTTYKVIFEGKLSADTPAPEIRRRLLRIYRDNEGIVDRFFSGKTLIVRKNIDYQTAEKIRVILQNAGAHCRVVEDHPLPAAKPQRPPADRSPEPSKGDTAPLADNPRAGQTPLQAGPEAETRRIKTKTESTVGRRTLSGTRNQNVLAAVMIVLIIVAGGIRLWALKQAGGIYPPDHVSANENGVCIHSNKTLFFLSPDGNIQKRVSLADLGIRGEPADLQLLKNGDLLIGDLASGEIKRCVMSTLSCRRIGPAGKHALTGYFKLLPDEERNLLLIADAENSMLLSQDLDGTLVHTISATSEIRAPAGMAFDRKGRLWVSNTGLGELLAFEFGDNAFQQTGAGFKLRPAAEPARNLQEKLKSNPRAGAGGLKDLMEIFGEIQKEQERLGDDLIQTRPQALAPDPEGNLWVAVSDGFLTSAGVRVFSPEGSQVGRLPLEKGALPLDIAYGGDRMIVADSGLFRIYSVSPDTRTPTPFGDKTFQDELSKTHSELRRYEAIKTWAGRCMALLALGAIILVGVIAAQSFSRKKQTVTPAPVSESRARAMPSATAGVQSSGIIKRYGVEFTGSGAEYFRIWIVNVFLTILTLGIYAAWAKVRTRRYFYRNTLLDGHPFDYTADPVALLKGYAIVAAGLLLYYLVKTFNPLYSLVVFGLFSLVVPLLIYKSLRFFTHNSVYRNIRFRFLGTAGEGYRTYLFYALLIPFTLGLIVPYWDFRRRKYFFDNLAYGATSNAFAGTHGPFYGAYVRMWLLLFALFWAGVIIAGVAASGIAGMLSPGKGPLAGGVLATVFALYAAVLLVGSFIQMYLYAWATNYCLRNSSMGRLGFESALSGWKLFWIRVSSVPAIVLSLGLLIPWAKVRRMRYIAESVAVIAEGDLNDFTAAAGTDESSYGDVASDFFDLEIGL